VKNRALSSGWFRLLAVMALLVVACGSPTTGHMTSASRATPTVAINPTPIVSPPKQCTPSNRCLALVTLRGSSSIVVRDITDIAHPTTVSTLGTIYEPQFVNATELSFLTVGAFVHSPLAGYPKTQVAKLNAGATFAWSPDGQTAAYVTGAPPGGGQFHLVSGGHDRLVSPMPPFYPAGCETQTGCERLNTRLLYSPNGAYISLVNSWPGPAFRVWSSVGKVLKSMDTGFTTWSVWSGNGLYFRDDKGVEIWRDGAVSLLLPGVAWIRPSSSAGGGQIVYMVRDRSGTAHIDLLDTTDGRVRELKSSRSYPAFLTSRFIWYEGERPCASGDRYPCGTDGKTIANGKTYIYDLQDGTETESRITGVFDAWPHPA
jgi:hypothetical protein